MYNTRLPRYFAQDILIVKFDLTICEVFVLNGQKEWGG